MLDKLIQYTNLNALFFTELLVKIIGIYMELSTICESSMDIMKNEAK